MDKRYKVNDIDITEEVETFANAMNLTHDTVFDMLRNVIIRFGEKESHPIVKVEFPEVKLPSPHLGYRTTIFRDYFDK